MGDGPTIYDFEKLVALDGSRHVTVLGVEAKPQLKDNVLDVVYWDIPEESTLGVIRWLEENRKSVENVHIGGTFLDGVWRCVHVRRLDLSGVRHKQGANAISQTFSKGYYRTFSMLALRRLSHKVITSNDKSVGLGLGVVSENPLEFLTIEHPYVDRSYAQEVCNVARTRRWENFTLDGTYYSGVWTPVVVSDERADDGSSAIVIVLAKSKYILEVYANYGEPNYRASFLCSDVPLAEADSIIMAWRDVASPGATAEVSGYDKNTGTVDILLSKNHEENVDEFESGGVDTCFETINIEVTKSAEEPAAVPSVEPGVIVDVRNRKTPLGKYDVQKTTREAKQFTGARTEFTDTTFASSSLSADRNVQQPLPRPEIEDGKIIEVSSEKNENCTWDVARRIRESKKVDDAVVESSSTSYEDVKSRQHVSVEEEDLSSQQSANGVIVEHVVKKSEFPGRFDETLRKRSVRAVENARNAVVDNTYQRVEERLNVGVESSGLVNGESADGQIVRVETRKSEFPDRYDQNIEVREAHAVQNASQSTIETEYEQRNTVANTAVAEPSSVTPLDGQVVAHTVKKSEFPDRFDEEIDIRTGKPVAGASVRTSVDQFGVVVSTFDSNVANPPTQPPTPGDKQKVELEVRKSEYKNRYNVTSVVDTAQKVEGARVVGEEDNFKAVEVISDYGISSEELRIATEEWAPGTTVSVAHEKLPHVGAYKQDVTIVHAKEGRTGEHAVKKLHNGTTLFLDAAKNVLADESGKLPEWAEHPEVMTDGIGLEIRRYANEFGGFAVEKTKITAEFRAVPSDAHAENGWLKFLHRDGFLYVREYHNVLPAQLSTKIAEINAKAQDVGGHVYPRIDYDPGTNTFTIAAYVYQDNGNGTRGNNMYQVVNETWEEVVPVYTNMQNSPGAVPTTYVRRERYSVGIIQRPSLSSALDDAKTAIGSNPLASDIAVSTLGTWGYRVEWRAKIDEGEWSVL